MINLSKIEVAIIQFIEHWYECKFRGRVVVEMPFSDTYQVKLILNQSERPINLTYGGTFEGFCDFIANEIASRGLARTEYYTGYKDGNKPTFFNRQIITEDSSDVKPLGHILLEMLGNILLEDGNKILTE